MSVGRAITAEPNDRLSAHDDRRVGNDASFSQCAADVLHANYGLRPRHLSPSLVDPHFACTQNPEPFVAGNAIVLPTQAFWFRDVVTVHASDQWSLRDRKRLVQACD